MPAIICPYTGAEISLTHVLGRGWIPVGAYNPHAPHASEAELRSAIRTRAGRPGALKTRALKCPYSGDEMTPVERSPGHWVASGGFCPVQVYSSTEEAERALMTRGGKAPAAVPRMRVEVVRDESEPPPANPLAGTRGSPGDEIDEFVARTVRPDAAHPSVGFGAAGT